ncbi:MAG: Crp/Fnr family transcriptional regulator [Clostridiaceae bacterium]|nr:Crp/Fnr family transcriptional regulator [Clostridiaceae bacterium]
MYDKWIKVLSGSLLFDGIDSKELELMLECLKPKIVSCRKNEFIVASGEKFVGIGILLSGSASVSKENFSGNRVIIEILKPGEMFGEMAAFSKNAVWPASVLTQDECSVIFISPEKIIGECEKMCPSHKSLMKNMLRIVSEKALMLNRKVEYLSIKSMRAKICTYLFEQYKKSGSKLFMIPMNRNELADFLNVSRPSMSREMSRLREEGIIDFHRDSIRINDIEALKEMLEI